MNNDYLSKNILHTKQMYSVSETRLHKFVVDLLPDPDPEFSQKKF